MRMTEILACLEHNKNYCISTFHSSQNLILPQIRNQPQIQAVSNYHSAPELILNSQILNQPQAQAVSNSNSAPTTKTSLKFPNNKSVSPLEPNISPISSLLPHYSENMES